MQINLDDVKIEPSWKEVLKDEFLSENFARIKENFLKAKSAGVVYPPSGLIFNAFNLTPFHDVKVVILGQDPYHGANQAMGLSFSVPSGVRVPPSLVNIYKEIDSDVGKRNSRDGDLTSWAEQGVLLLNNVLTVEAHLARSHRGKGWEIFTRHCVEHLSKNREHLVFILWGRDAREKKSLIDGKKHLILESAHPSPLSAYQGFFGSKPFSKTNDYLSEHGQAPIEW